MKVKHFENTQIKQIVKIGQEYFYILEVSEYLFNVCFSLNIPLLVLDVSLGIPISSANKGNRQFNIFSKF